MLLTANTDTDIFYMSVYYYMRASQVAPMAKNPPTSAGDERDSGLIPGLGRLGRSSGEGYGNPLQYSSLENPMDRAAWRAIVHRVTKSRT